MSCAELSNVTQERKDTFSLRRQCEENPGVGLSRFMRVREPVDKAFLSL